MRNFKKKANERISISISRKVSTAPYESVDMTIFDSWDVDANISEQELKNEYNNKFELLKSLLRQQEILIKRKVE
jgi:hypothetical protein